MYRRGNAAARRLAFTLIELLVVVSIISVLVAILVPALGKAREQARRAVCASNQKQISSAVYMYAEDHDNVLPLFISPTGHSECSNIIWFAAWSGMSSDLAGLGHRCGLGLLQRADIVGDRTIFFCPSGYRVYPVRQDSSWVAYYWRFYSKTGPPGDWPKLDRQPPRRALMADAFALHSSGWGRGPEDFWHQDGMMVARMDTSVTWQPDGGNMIRYGLEPGGAWYGNPRGMVFYVWGRLDKDQGW